MIASTARIDGLVPSVFRTLSRISSLGESAKLMPMMRFLAAGVNRANDCLLLIIVFFTPTVGMIDYKNKKTAPELLDTSKSK